VEGTIVSYGPIVGFPTIIPIYVDTGDRIFPVYFDHRPFWHFFEALGGKLLGRKVRVVDNPEGWGEVVEVLN